MAATGSFEDFIKAYINNKIVSGEIMSIGDWVVGNAKKRKTYSDRLITLDTAGAMSAPVSGYRAEAIYGSGLQNSGYRDYVSAEAERKRNGALEDFRNLNDMRYNQKESLGYSEYLEKHKSAGRDEYESILSAEEKRKEAERAAAEKYRGEKLAEKAKAEEKAKKEKQKAREEISKAKSEYQKTVEKRAKEEAEAKAKAESEAKKATEKKAKEEAAARAKAEAEAKKAAEKKAKEEAAAKKAEEAAAKKAAEEKAKAEEKYKSLISKAETKILSSKAIDFGSAYKIAISAGLNEEDAKRVAEDKAREARDALKRDILETIILKTLTRSAAYALAISKGLSESEAAELGNKARELNQTVPESGYLDYLREYDEKIRNESEK